MAQIVGGDESPRLLTISLGNGVQYMGSGFSQLWAISRANPSSPTERNELWRVLEILELEIDPQTKGMITSCHTVGQAVGGRGGLITARIDRKAKERRRVACRNV